MTEHVKNTTDERIDLVVDYITELIDWRIAMRSGAASFAEYRRQIIDNEFAARLALADALAAIATENKEDNK